MFAAAAVLGARAALLSFAAVLSTHFQSQKRITPRSVLSFLVALLKALLGEAFA
ncbi:hypothetical protein [Parvibaculum sp.]|uniref:hypothetical protein n=1 Tax=Parvibaculum sp. TaxID=2024848 RepID=UPI0032114CB7